MGKTFVFEIYFPLYELIVAAFVYFYKKKRINGKRPDIG